MYVVLGDSGHIYPYYGEVKIMPDLYKPKIPGKTVLGIRRFIGRFAGVIKRNPKHDALFEILSSRENAKDFTFSRYWLERKKVQGKVNIAIWIANKVYGLEYSVYNLSMEREDRMEHPGWAYSNKLYAAAMELIIFLKDEDPSIGSDYVEKALFQEVDELQKVRS